MFQENKRVSLNVRNSIGNTATYLFRIPGKDGGKSGFPKEALYELKIFEKTY